MLDDTNEIMASVPDSTYVGGEIYWTRKRDCRRTHCRAFVVSEILDSYICGLRLNERIACEPSVHLPGEHH